MNWGSGYTRLLGTGFFLTQGTCTYPRRPRSVAKACSGASNILLITASPLTGRHVSPSDLLSRLLLPVGVTSGRPVVRQHSPACFTPPPLSNSETVRLGSSTGEICHRDSGSFLHVPGSMFTCLFTLEGNSAIYILIDIKLLHVHVD